MKVTYNPKLNIGYIQLREALKKGEHVDTICISEELNIDIAPDGRIFGIELLNANEQLHGDGDVLQLINANTNKSQELPL